MPSIQTPTANKRRQSEQKVLTHCASTIIKLCDVTTVVQISVTRLIKITQDQCDTKSPKICTQVAKLPNHPKSCKQVTQNCMKLFAKNWLQTNNQKSQS